MLAAARLFATENFAMFAASSVRSELRQNPPAVNAVEPPADEHSATKGVFSSTGRSRDPLNVGPFLKVTCRNCKRFAPNSLLTAKFASVAREVPISDVMQNPSGPAAFAPPAVTHLV